MLKKLFGLLLVMILFAGLSAYAADYNLILKVGQSLQKDCEDFGLSTATDAESNDEEVCECEANSSYFTFTGKSLGTTTVYLNGSKNVAVTVVPQFKFAGNTNLGFKYDYLKKPIYDNDGLCIAEDLEDPDSTKNPDINPEILLNFTFNDKNNPILPKKFGSANMTLFTLYFDLSNSYNYNVEVVSDSDVNIVEVNFGDTYDKSVFSNVEDNYGELTPDVSSNDYEVYWCNGFEPYDVIDNKYNQVGYQSLLITNSKTGYYTYLTVRIKTDPITDIILEKDRYNFKVGQAENLKDMVWTKIPDTADSQTVRYEINNTDIVSNAPLYKLFAVAPGSTDIKVYSIDDPTINKTFKAYVTADINLLIDEEKVVKCPEIDDDGYSINNVESIESLNPDILQVNYTSGSEFTGKGLSEGFAKVKYTTSKGEQLKTVYVGKSIVNAYKDYPVEINKNILENSYNYYTGFPFNKEISDIIECYDVDPDGVFNKIEIENNNIVFTPTKSGAHQLMFSTDESYYGYLIMVTNGVPVEWIQIEGPDFINLGETAQLSAYVYPEDATVKDVTWESLDQSVATVDPNGLVTPLKTGTVEIKITSVDNPKATASRTIEVVGTKVPVTGVELIGPSSSLKIGDKYQLICNVFPEDATDKSVTYIALSPSLISVDQNGVVTALANGNAVVWARTNDGYYIAACSISIGTPVKSVKLNKSMISLKTNDTYQLTYTINPKDAINKTVRWKSSNESVATVSQSGKVTATGRGEATITVITNDGNKKSYCKVYVKQPVTSVKLNTKKEELFLGDTYTLKATVLPSDANNKKVTWSSSDPSVATVNSKGKVTAVGLGKAVITVKTEDGNKKATCNIKVVQPVTGVSIVEEKIVIKKGATKKIVAIVSPKNAQYKQVVWTSSNSKNVKVDKNGIVKGLKSNTSAYIYVTTVDGGYTDKILVYVR